MLRLTLAAVGVTAAIILAPTVDAQPKLCDNHGTGQGQIYIHACAVGGGGAGPFVLKAVDTDGDGVPDTNKWTR